jgi:adenylate cyclase
LYNPRVAEGATRAAAKAISAKLSLLLFLGNFLGALLTFFYFRFVDFQGPEELSRVTSVEIAYSLVAFAALGLVAVWRSRRWIRPLIAAARQDSPSAVEDTLVRQRALLLPYMLASMALIGWILAGGVWGILWPLLAAGLFSPTSALRSVFGITVIAGSVTTAFIFFAAEQLWRQRLPYYFPRGDLSSTRGVLRVGVRTRLILIFLLVSLVPLALVGVMSYTRAAALLAVEAARGAVLLQDLLTLIVFMLVVGGLAAVGLSIFVSRSVAGPLRDLEAAMGEVASGNLQVQCPVVSNDEIGAVAEGFNRMVDGLRERELIRETFGKYVTREVRDEILSGRVTLEGQMREVTILFADLRDFTPWVEAHDPREVVGDLNAYFTLMEDAIRGHHGLVLQYIGDEIEAVFGAPIPHPRHPELAVQAACEMRRRLYAWNAERARVGRPLLRHGIGIHTGRVLAGNIGSPDRLSWTLVGDPVNLAARLQALNKDLGSDILVSAETARRLEGASGLEPLPAVMVKGKATAVEVYRVT